MKGATLGEDDGASLDPFFRRIEACNEGADEQKNLIPFYVGGHAVGFLRPQFAQDMLSYAQPGDITHSVDVENTGSTDPTAVRLRATDPEQRTQALARLTSALREAGIIKGWRDELYPVTRAFHDAPLAVIERAAAPHFGIKSYGVHVNGYVVDSDGGLSMWAARRARNKPTWPGLLDHIVAGGQPAGMSCGANVVKECGEEAGIPPALAGRARPAGCVSYAGMTPDGLKRDVLFVYDLLLPSDFKPVPQDGEVEEFFLLPIKEIYRLVRDTTEYKPNCALVITDFMVRQGVITPEQPRYGELIAALRSADCA